MIALISFITLRIYKVLKQLLIHTLKLIGFITLRIYKVLKPSPIVRNTLTVLSH